MTIVGAGGSELAELVAHHLLGDEHGNMLLAVVDAEGQPHKLGQDGGAPAPHLDHLIAAALTNLVGLLQEKAVDEGTFPDRAGHCLATSLTSCADDASA